MTNEIEKKVGNSMLDDLLGDDDKKNKPAPKRTDYGGYSHYSGYRNYYGGRTYNSDTGRFDDDDTADMFGWPETRRTYAPVRNAAEAREEARTMTDFAVRGEKIAEIMESGVTYDESMPGKDPSFSHCITVADMDAIITVLMTEIGDLLEEGNLLWNATTQRNLRGELREVIANSWYFKKTDQANGTGGYIKVDVEGWPKHDPNTGEVE